MKLINLLKLSLNDIEKYFNLAESEELTFEPDCDQLWSMLLSEIICLKKNESIEKILTTLLHIFPNMLEKSRFGLYSSSILYAILFDENFDLERKKYLFNIILPNVSQELICLRDSQGDTVFECCVYKKQIELAYEIYWYIEDPREKIKAALLINDIQLIAQLYEQIADPIEKLKIALRIKSEDKILQCIDSYSNPFYKNIDMSIRAEIILTALNSHKIDFFQIVMKQFYVQQFNNVELLNGTKIDKFDIVEWMNTFVEDVFIHKEKIQFIFTELWVNNERLHSYYNTYPLIYMIEKSLSLSSIEKYISKNELDRRYTKGVQGLNCLDTYDQKRIVYGIEVTNMFPMNMAVLAERPDILYLLIAKGASEGQGISFRIVDQAEEISCSNISSFVTKILWAKKSWDKTVNIEIKKIIKEFYKCIKKKRQINALRMGKLELESKLKRKFEYRKFELELKHANALKKRLQHVGILRYKLEIEIELNRKLVRELERVPEIERELELELNLKRARACVSKLELELQCNIELESATKLELELKLQDLRTLKSQFDHKRKGEDIQQSSKKARIEKPGMGMQ